MYTPPHAWATRQYSFVRRDAGPAHSVTVAEMAAGDSQHVPSDRN
jgi:hypothetical protein